MTIDSSKLTIHIPKNNIELRDQLRNLVYGEDQFTVRLYDSPTTIFTHHTQLTKEMIQPLLKLLNSQVEGGNNLRLEYDGRDIERITEKELQSLLQ